MPRWTLRAKLFVRNATANSFTVLPLVASVVASKASGSGILVQTSLVAFLLFLLLEVSQIVFYAMSLLSFCSNLKTVFVSVHLILKSKRAPVVIVAETAYSSILLRPAAMMAIYKTVTAVLLLV